MTTERFCEHIIRGLHNSSQCKLQEGEAKWGQEDATLVALHCAGQRDRRISHTDGKSTPPPCLETPNGKERGWRVEGEEKWMDYLGQLGGSALETYDQITLGECMLTYIGGRRQPDRRVVNMAGLFGENVRGV